MTETNNQNISPARIIWKNNTPYSELYDDIYFSTENGLEESQHVFINNNFLAERWTKASTNNLTCFTIAETGFGTGLNFLNTWANWNKEKLPNDHTPLQLHYISFEKHPLEKSDLQKSLNLFPKLKHLSTQLLENYPPLTKGFHRLSFQENNIHLTLIFGDALCEIKCLPFQIGTNKPEEGLLASGLVDAWFLDGFSPKSNQQLWSSELLTEIAKLSKHKATFSTFTAAGEVRRNLQARGFTCTKVKGFGKKREMLTGIYSAINSLQDKPSASINTTSIGLDASQEPWYIKSKHTVPKEKKAIIIGAGLAGSWTAYFLACRGWQVHIHDKQENIADGASGNPRAALFFKVNTKQNKQAEFANSSFLYAQQALNALDFSNEVWDQCGLIQLAFDEKETKKQQQVFNAGTYSNDIAQWLSAEHLSSIAGVTLNTKGIYFPLSGSADPKQLCNLLCASSKNISVFNKSNITKLNFINEESCWEALNDQAQIIDKAETVIVCSSFEAKQFNQIQELPLFQVRGQINTLQASPASEKLNTVICTNAYTTPAYAPFISERFKSPLEHNQSYKQHCIGASFDPRDKNPKVNDSDTQNNLLHLKNGLPTVYKLFNESKSPKVTSARAAFRCQSPDYLPIVGQVPNQPWFMDSYQGLRQGQLKKDYPLGQYHPRLYINVGHGSRGLSSCPISAQALACTINDEPSPLDPQVANLLEPARFYIRHLKKNLK